MMQQRQELQAAAVPSGRAANDGETQTGHTSGNIHRAGVASLPGAQQPPLQPATGRAMKRPRDGAPPAAQDGGECGTGQGLVALVWSEEASRQLLQLRFHRLWRQFDAAQSATQLHEAWELLAAQLSGAGLGYGFDAAQCVAQKRVSKSATRFAGVHKSSKTKGQDTTAREAGTMFKRFSVEEHMSTSSKVKSSQQRSIRSKVLEQYPELEPYAELLMPKKAPMVVAKW
ncbi:hypothetical protein BBJ28_00015886 [Nothophytophthora sp. Chile5]|nr:hypothetical protein BBJ28_00015886 [Nothophytophthora sp. Chile5]